MCKLENTCRRANWRVRTAPRLLGSALLLLLLFISWSAFGEQPIPASQFVDSIGVNTHLHYGPLYTDDFPLVLQRLRELGVHHIRNGLQATKKPEFYDRVKAVNDAGIKVLWILNADQPSDLALSYLNRFPSGFDGFEAPNEFDASKRSDWIPVTKQYMSHIYSLVKKDPRASRLLIVGPSLTRPQSYAALGDQSGYMDVANLHNYPGSRNPGTPGWGAANSHGARYGSIAWNLQLGQDVWGAKPVWTTEYGYNNSDTASDGVPEDIAAIYLPRALLEQYLHGIRRTYLFELLSAHAGHDGTYGVLRIDGSPKPSFLAVSNFLRLLSDDSRTFTLSPVEFSLAGDMTDVHHLLLQKSDSSYFLLLWIEKPCFDPNSRRRIPVLQQAISVRLGQSVGNLESYRLQANGTLSQFKEKLDDGHRLPVTISDTVLAIHFSTTPSPQ